MEILECLSIILWSFEKFGFCGDSKGILERFLQSFQDSFGDL